MRNIPAILMVLLLSGCGRNSPEVLSAKGRPGPITCIRVSDSEDKCSDGGGIAWACQRMFGDNECIAIGQVGAEIR